MAGPTANLMRSAVRGTCAPRASPSISFSPLATAEGPPRPTSCKRASTLAPPLPRPSGGKRTKGATEQRTRPSSCSLQLQGSQLSPLAATRRIDCPAPDRSPPGDEERHVGPEGQARAPIAAGDDPSSEGGPLRATHTAAGKEAQTAGCQWRPTEEAIVVTAPTCGGTS